MKLTLDFNNKTIIAEECTVAQLYDKIASLALSVTEWNIIQKPCNCGSLIYDYSKINWPYYNTPITVTNNTTNEQ
jgi:hypothetical protein